MPEVMQSIIKLLLLTLPPIILPTFKQKMAMLLPPITLPTKLQVATSIPEM